MKVKSGWHSYHSLVFTQADWLWRHRLQYVLM